MKCLNAKTRSGGSLPDCTAADMTEYYKMKCTFCHGNTGVKKFPKVMGGSRDEKGNRGLNVNQSAPNSRGKKSAVVFPWDQSCL